jgi:hypothetical protein
VSTPPKEQQSPEYVPHGPSATTSARLFTAEARIRELECALRDVTAAAERAQKALR